MNVNKSGFVCGYYQVNIALLPVLLFFERGKYGSQLHHPRSELFRFLQWIRMPLVITPVGQTNFLRRAQNLFITTLDVHQFHNLHGLVTIGTVLKARNVGGMRGFKDVL